MKRKEIKLKSENKQTKNKPKQPRNLTATWWGIEVLIGCGQNKMKRIQKLMELW